MTGPDTRTAKFDCLELINLVRKAADDKDAEAYADGFSEDGVWIPGNGVPIRGRKAIQKALAAVPAHLITRHVSGGSVVSFLSTDTAVVQTQVVLYTGSAAAGLPVALQPPDKVFDYNDELRRTAEGWKITKRRTELIFVRQA